MVEPYLELLRAGGSRSPEELAAIVGLDLSDPAIWAAGDCASFPWRDGRLRLESVGNAIDMAEAVAANMLGAGAPYVAAPWFWSDQYDVKLQIAGIALPHDAQVVRGEVGPQGYSVFYYRDARLVAADSVNRPAEHMACRKLLMQGTMLAPEAAADPAVDLLALTRS